MEAGRKLRTFVVLVEDVPGVLDRVASLFRRRGYNIESFTVGHTDRAGVSHFTVTMNADDRTSALVEANLYKLETVLEPWPSGSSGAPRRAPTSSAGSATSGRSWPRSTIHTSPSSTTAARPRTDD